MGSEEAEYIRLVSVTLGRPSAFKYKCAFDQLLRVERIVPWQMSVAESPITANKIHHTHTSLHLSNALTMGQLLSQFCCRAKGQPNENDERGSLSTYSVAKEVPPDNRHPLVLKAKGYYYHLEDGRKIVRTARPMLVILTL